MSRINQPKANNTQQAQQAQKPQAPKTPPGAKSVFAQSMRKKDGGKKTKASANDGKADTLADSLGSEKSEGGLLLHRQGPSVLGRRKGTVADLQARLENQGSSKGLSAGAEAGVNKEGGIAAEGKAGLGGKEGLSLEGDGLKLQDDKLDLSQFQTGNPALNAPPSLSQAPTVVTVKGNTVPAPMMDKMVEHCRLGVNELGNAEFQFELKGDVMGGMKMNVTMEDGQLKAVFIAENPDVRKLMEANVKDLEKNLRDRGIVINSIDIRDPEKDKQQKRDQRQKERQEGFEQ